MWVNNYETGQLERTRREKMARVERALISVSDKTGIVEFARELQHLGVRLFLQAVHQNC